MGLYYQGKLEEVLSADVTIVALYSGVADEVWQAVLNPQHSGACVILTTNYSESSCTIPGVEAVIDFCKEKLRTRDGLEVHFISQASGKQRRGRSGRQSPGHSLKMMLEADYNRLKSHREPAVCRLALSEVVLGLLNRGVMKNSSHAVRILEQLPSPPSASHVATDVKTLEILHLTAQGCLTQVGKAVADLHLSAEEGVVLLSAAFLGVGRFACWLLAATSSQQLLESICNSQYFSKDRRSALCSPSSSCDLLLLARVMEIYRWDNSISSPFVDSVLKDVRVEALEYERIIECWLGPDDASMDDLYFTDVWPRIHFAFAASQRHNFALHLKNGSMFG